MEQDSEEVIYIDNSDIEQDVVLEMDAEEIIPKDNVTIAEEKKNLGNDQYKAQNYREAAQFYSEAISYYPDQPSYYGNRAACYMMMGDYKLALDDARYSVSVDAQFEKGYIRIAKCCLILGDLIGTDQALKKLEELDPLNSVIKTERNNLQQVRQLEEKFQQNYEKKGYRTCIFFLDSALKIASACLKYKLLKAECLAYLGRIDEANDIAVTAMKTDPTSADAIYVRGLCLYYNDNLDKGILHFERTLQLDPDHVKAKEMRTKSKKLRDLKEKGNTFFKTGKLRDAQITYTSALEIDPLNQDMNSKLYYNRALVNSKLGNLRDAVNDCTKVLEINGQYLKALLLRARCHNDLAKYDECIKDYEAALKIQKTPDIKNLLRDAKLALRRSKRKDYYKILGVARNASDEEIKKAYRKKALVHHPDRHASSSDVDKKEQELKFKEIGEAYAMLSDPRKKALYDSGKDMDDEQQDFDPNQMFQHFFAFNNGGGGTFSFQF